jgi:hypothetical protein
MKRGETMLFTVPVTVLLMAIGERISAQAVDSAIPTYLAIYDVEYKGKALGTAQFSVSHDAEREIYRFESQMQAKGLLAKLVAPKPVIQRSEFRVDGSTITPLEFWYEDGSRKGEDNLHIVFDWDSRIATTNGEDGRRELPLEPGVLDRGAAQVALRRDLATAGQPGKYPIAEADGVRADEYAVEGEETIATGIGNVAALKLMQHREGSSRTTRVWMAPGLGYLPIRIEQHRNGELQTAFTLQSMETPSGE